MNNPFIEIHKYQTKTKLWKACHILFREALLVNSLNNSVSMSGHSSDGKYMNYAIYNILRSTILSTELETTIISFLIFRLDSLP